MEKPQGGTQSLDRAFQLVEIIAEANKPLPLKEITAESKLPKPTVYRLLTALETWGYLDQDQDKNYRLGTKLLYLGNKVKESIDIPKLAYPYLKKLNDATKETIFLGVLDKGRSLYVAKLDSHHSVRLASGVGSRNYLHCTSLGKCLLSGIDDAGINHLVEKHGMPKRTVMTITEPSVLLETIKEVKDRGYAIDDGENEDGVRCVAAPIKNFQGEVVAAISISGPAQRITFEYIENELLEKLLMTATDISKALGHHSK